MEEFTICPIKFSGRPENAGQRLPKEQMCYELLDELNIQYDRVDHDAADTIAACHQVETVLESEICKNLFLCNRQKTQFYLLLMPGSKPFRTKELSAQIGSARLSFASEEYMEQFLDLTPGSVTVLGLMNDTDNRVQLLIDEDVVKDEYFGCHPCINTSSLKMKTNDILEKFLPAVHHEPIFVKLGAE